MSAMAVLVPVVDMSAVAFMAVVDVIAISALLGKAAEEDPNQTALVLSSGRFMATSTHTYSLTLSTDWIWAKAHKIGNSYWQLH